jgi:hypothetical protein
MAQPLQLQGLVVLEFLAHIQQAEHQVVAEVVLMIVAHLEIMVVLAVLGLLVVLG